MADMFATKDSAGCIMLWPSEPDKFYDDFGVNFDGPLGPLARIDQEAARVLVKGLNLRKGQCKRVKLMEVTDNA